MEYSPGAGYAARLEALAARGVDLHGEAKFCAGLIATSARVLDAGCGTGRVSARLAELGFDCVGVDRDPSMLEFAPSLPGARWIQGNLAELDLPAQGVPADFDLVVAAGNVIPLVDQDSAAEVVRRLSMHLRPGGLLVVGFGLDRSHLPEQAVEVALTDYDQWCTAAGLTLQTRHATWDGDPYDGGGYAVSVHRRQVGGARGCSP